MIAIPGVDPILMWAGFLALVGVLLAIDLGVFHRKAHAVSIKEALIWAGVWFGLAMVFNLWIYFQFGSASALEFLTGYLIEKSLSVDNLFVFLIIFTAFSIPAEFQHRVLFWGILGAVITRGIFIGLGAAITAHFAWAFFLFGLALLYAAYRMQFQDEEKFDSQQSRIVKIVGTVIPVSRKLDGNRFFTRESGKRAITLLLLTLIVIELTDILFAFDSIPAIFAVTSDPFIVFTSNIFAILGLRSLYFVLADMQTMFAHLKTGLSVILFFIAVKLLLKPFHYEIPIIISLVFILSVLLISIFASMARQRKAGALAVTASAAAETAPASVPVPQSQPAHAPPLASPIPAAPALKGGPASLPRAPRRRTAKKKKR